MPPPKSRDRKPPAPPHPREGWEESFRRAGPSDDDELLLPEIGLTTWEDEEWGW